MTSPLFSLSIIAVLLATLSTDASARPSDVQRLSIAAKAIEKHVTDGSGTGKEEVRDALSKSLLKLAREVVRRHTFGKLIDLEDPSIQRMLVQPVLQGVDKAYRHKEVSKRRDALYDALILASSTTTVHAAFSTYLRLPEPGKLTALSFTEAVPSFETQVSLTSDTSNLEVLPKESSIVMDFGGSGSDNGVIDAGEWVNLELAVANRSALPYFSSSAFVQSQSDCLWVPPSREYTFPELPPSKSENKGSASKAKPTGVIATWVYLSRTCRDGQRATLNINVKDSHRTKNARHTLRASLLVRNRGRANVSDYLVDHDVPGWSDGGKRPPLGAGRQVELSHALTFQSEGFERARMGWGISSIQKDLISSHSFRRLSDPIVDPNNRSKLLPGDDLDLELVGERRFAMVTDELAGVFGWRERADAKLIAATDVILLYRDPDPEARSETTKVEKVILSEVTCADGFDNDGDGKVDCADSDCAENSLCVCGPESDAPLDAEEVISLVESTTTITPRLAKPSSPDAMHAISVAGYELSFDKSDFTKRYECMVKDIPLSKCGQAKCKDCNKTMAPPKRTTVWEEKKTLREGEKRYVAYRLRNYFALPIDWSVNHPPENCVDGVDNDRDGQIDCADSDCLNSPNCRRVERRCTDGIDNDKDGAIDCMDPDCARRRVCQPAKAEVCDNGYDDDRDLFYDCDDPDCSDDPACIATSKKVWLDLAFSMLFGGYQYTFQPPGLEDSVSDESYSLLGFRAGVAIAPMRLMAQDGLGLTLGLAGRYFGGENKSVGSMQVTLGWAFSPSDWLELHPYFGLGVYNFSFDEMAGQPAALEPQTLGAFSAGLNLRVYPFGEHVYLGLHGGFAYLTAESRSDSSFHIFELGPTLGIFDVGAGYRF